MSTTTIRFQVFIYKPVDEKITLRSFMGGFATSQVSNTLANLSKQAFSKDTDGLQILSNIRAHHLMGAAIPDESRLGVHKFLGYAMAPNHPAELALAIWCYSVVRDGQSTPERLPIARLTLRGVQLLRFAPSEEDNGFTVSFKVTGGDELTLGAASNEPVEQDLPPQPH